MDEIQPPATKILVIRFSSIGDIVLTTPILRAIKEQVQGVELHYLTKKENLQILAPNPRVDKIYCFSRKGKSKLIEQLKAEKYDVVIDLQKSRRSCHIVNALHVTHYTFFKVNFLKWVCVNFKLNFLPDLHVVERYFKAVEPIGVLNDHQGLEYYIPKDEEFDEDDLPMVFEDGFVAFVLGSQHETKRIPESKIVEIASILHKPIMLLGGKDVVNIGENVAAQLGDRAYNGCGKYSLHQSASILKQADCVITGDTGLMHIAAAFNKPTAVIWGNTIPEFGMYPYMPQNRDNFRNFEVCTLKCRPCSKFGYKKCPRKHFNCMNNISAVEVADWINKY